MEQNQGLFTKGYVMNKITPENRMITKCDLCNSELDTMNDEMFCNDTIIYCSLCKDDSQFDSQYDDESNNEEKVNESNTTTAYH